MSDITDAIDLTIAAVQAAAAVGIAVTTWWGGRQESKKAKSTVASEAETQHYRQDPQDLLYIMATMGQWMFYLDVINFTALPAARSATRSALKASDPDDDELGQEFDAMSLPVQNAVASAMVFCADCWPMHMYNGFGCGVFNDLTWADPNNPSLHGFHLDNAIAALKSQPHQWQLLTKSPFAIGKTDPCTEAIEKSTARKIASMQKDVFRQFEKDGFPQPVSPYDHITINYWWIPFATWNGSSMYDNQYHLADAISGHQCDPGRFFWAWTAGKHARVAPGEALLIPDDLIGALAQWLEGLNGIPFRVLLDNQVNCYGLRYGRSLRNVLKKQFGNEHGIRGVPFVIVHDPHIEAVKQLTPDQLATKLQYLQHLQINTGVGTAHPVSPDEPPQYSSTVQSPVSDNISFPTTQARRRRPVPQPPQAAVRTVIATHAFTAESAGELAFAKDDVIEVLDDKSDDGWWKARLQGQVGLIPNTYVKDASAEDVQQSKQSQMGSPGSDRPAFVNSIAATGSADQDQKPDYFSKRNSVIRKPLRSGSTVDCQSPQSPASCLSSVPLSSPGSGEQQHWKEVATCSPVSSTAYFENGITLNTSSQIPFVHPHEADRPPAIEGLPQRNPIAWGLTRGQIKYPTLLTTLTGHAKKVLGVAFSPDSCQAASASADKTIRLWQTATGGIQHVLSGHTSDVTDICFTPNGNILASASHDYSAKIWDLNTATATQTLDQSNMIYGVAVSPDGNLLAAALFSNKINIWDLRSSTLLRTLRSHKDMVRRVTFSPDGQSLASCSNDKTVTTWNVSTGLPINRIKAHPGMLNYVMGVAYSPDGKIIASGALDSTLKLWKADTGAAVRTINCETHVRDVKFLPDGKTIAVGTMLGQVILWNTEGEELLKVGAHTKGIESIAISATERLMATASEDKTVKLWRFD